MLRAGIPLGKIFGISLRLHYSWFIVFLLVTWALTVGYFPTIYPHWSLATSVTVGLVTSILFFASVLTHELAHSLVAQAAGIPIHSITLFIFGGVSQMTQEPERPGVEFRMALAGPATSLALGVLFWAIRVLTQGISEPLAALTNWLSWINFLLAGFNLIPGFPLDGGRVLRAIIWWRTGKFRSATRIASAIGRSVGYLFIFGGIWLIFWGLWLNGLWIALIGWFLQNAAAGSYRQLALQDMLRGHSVSEVMTRDCMAVPSKLTVEKLVHDHILGSGRRCFPVVEGIHGLGLVTLHNVKEVPRELWPMKTVGEVMVPLASLKLVRPDEDLSKVMQLLTDEDVNQLPVVENNSIIGIVARDNLLSFIRTRSELGIEENRE